MALVPPEPVLNCAATSCSASATSATAPAPVTLEVRKRFADVIGGVMERLLEARTADADGVTDRL
jgi:hypothetical protein